MNRRLQCRLFTALNVEIVGRVLSFFANDHQRGMHGEAPTTGSSRRGKTFLKARLEPHCQRAQNFKDLMATKKLFIVPAVVFFVVYYFALPILVGYAPHFMATRVIGVVNLAYLFALSQFFVAWIIACALCAGRGRFRSTVRRHHRQRRKSAKEASNHVNASC